MNVTFTCEKCGSGIDTESPGESTSLECKVCGHEKVYNFTPEHQKGELKQCPCCGRKDFYQQKDFNRKIGVVLFVIAAVLSIWTYGISLIVLWMVDFIFHGKLPDIAICYKCQAIFRKVGNIKNIGGFNHEMNDRIVYSDHDFQGKQLDH